MTFLGDFENMINEKREFRAHSGYSSPIFRLALSLDGKTLATTSFGPFRGETAVRLGRFVR